MTDNADDIASAARDWIVRMASGTMTAAELAAFRRWRAASPDHNAAFERERAIWRAVSLSGEQDRAVRATWKRLGRRRTLRRGLFVSSAAVASLLLVICAPVVSTWLRADEWTGTTIQSMVLADGSRVTLDSDTAIITRYTPTERTITLLRGNALFDVRHDPARPFRVIARDGMTQDVGTIFEVRRDVSHVSVTVSSGIVDVHAPRNSPDFVRLRAGERTRYADGAVTAIEHAIPSEEIAPWARGDLILDNATIHEAIAAITRYRSGHVFIIGNKADAARISGAFRTDEPDMAIAIMATTAGLSVSKLPGGMLLLRK